MQYHVFLQGKQLGPYDKRTIVGMRIKKTLANADTLQDKDGQQITVGQLLGQRSRPASLDLGVGNSAFDAHNSGVYSPVVGVFLVQRMLVSKGVRDVPRFLGAVQARVHTDLLRLEGTSRQLFRRKAGRVKLPFGQILRAQQQAANVALWLRTEARLDAHLRGAPSITLMLQTAEDAKALISALPDQVELVGNPLENNAIASKSVKKWSMSPNAMVGTFVGVAVGVVLAVLVMILFFRR